MQIDFEMSPSAIERNLNISKAFLYIHVYLYISTYQANGGIKDYDYVRPSVTAVQQTYRHGPMFFLPRRGQTYNA